MSLLMLDDAGASLEQCFVRAWVSADKHDDLRSEVDEMLAQLSSDEREFLRLVAVDGLSHEAIARQLRLPSAAASRQRLRRLRLQLQSFRRLDENGPDGSKSVEVRG